MVKKMMRILIVGECHAGEEEAMELLKSGVKKKTGTLGCLWYTPF